MRNLYPALGAYDSGRLDVGDGHSVYWETCGNPEGKPAIVLHGGPGSGCTAWHRRLFDPCRYRIVISDQRNCGRSRPHASTGAIDLTTNTTHHLVADIERLRDHLAVEDWLVLGGSWGSTLALAYAEAYADRATELVLFGVTAGLRREFDWMFRGGLAAKFPAPWRRLRDAVLRADDREGDVVEAVHRLLFDSDPSVRQQAAYEWCLWESAVPEWPPSLALLPRFRDSEYALCFARIVTHYVRHNAWLEDGALLDGASVLCETPTVLIDGRHDPQTRATSEELVRRIPTARHVVVEGASHAAPTSGIAAEIVRATDEFAANSDAQARSSGLDRSTIDSDGEPMKEEWRWDPTLFEGAAPYYERGRVGYAPGLADALRDALDLDGTGRLLDVGCGPGTVALLLEPLFEEVVGLDPDPGMLREGRRLAQVTCSRL